MPIHPAAGPHAAPPDNHGEPGISFFALAVKDIGLGRSSAAFRDNPVRYRFSQRFEHHLGHEMADLHPGSYRRREFTVYHRLFRSGHPDRSRGAFVDGNIGVKSAFDGHKHIGIGKIVDHIHPPVDLPGGPVKIDNDVRPADLHRQFYDDILPIPGTLDHPLIGINPVGNL